MHYGRCASDESSYIDRTSLVNKVLFLLPNYSQRFVLLLFSIFTSRQATKTLIYLIFSLTLSSVLCVNAKRSHGLLLATPRATNEGNHFSFPKPVLLFKTILKLTAAWLAPFGERRCAEREVTGSNPGRTNTQGL